jgi:hypothetical protein
MTWTQTSKADATYSVSDFKEVYEKIKNSTIDSAEEIKKLLEKDYGVLKGNWMLVIPKHLKMNLDTPELKKHIKFSEYVNEIYLLNFR